MLTARGDTNRKGAEGKGTGGPAPGAQALRRRRALPASRAVVGGFLVAAAAVGVFAAYTNASADHRVDYVVARQALTVGQHLGADDLTTEPMELPSSLAGPLAYRDPTRLVGAVVTEPVRAGELIQASDVATTASGLGQRQVSFPVDPSRAVDGTLAAGDSVDVLATYGTGPDASTMAVAIGVRVIAVGSAQTQLGSSPGPSEVVTVALTNFHDVLALTQAANAGQVMLVRSTGASPASGATTYKLPGQASPTAPSG